MSDFGMEATAPVKSATSAYMFFQNDLYSNHKGELAGLPFGQAGTEISRRWHALPPEPKAKFEALAAADRQRYESESAVRDSEMEARQAANREARFADPASQGYMRERAAVEPKKERKVTREEDMSEERLEARRLAKAKRDGQKAARLEAEAESERQKKSIATAAAAMARKRIKYILRQSDIFATHFGVTLSDSEGDDDDGDNGSDPSNLRNRNSGGAGAGAGAGAGSAGGSPSKRLQAGRGSKAAADETVEADGSAEETGPTYLMTQPPSITGGTMRSYQLEGLNWMINLQAQGTNGILADEMGLGKTLQSISILAYMRDFQKVNGPHLILLPKSVLGNWQLEFKRFCPSVRVLRLSGNKDERMETIQNDLKPGSPEDERDWDVLVTTYEVANIEKTALNKIGWRYLIIDEAHRLKNESSLFSMTVRELTTQYRLLLTGTPLQNNLHELWALLNFLLPTVFKDSEAFSKVFDLNVDDPDKKQNMIKQLHKILRPFMLRRLKKEVEKSLPPKEETILFTGMSEVQRKVYKGVLMRDIDAVNGGSAGRTAILNIVMQLRKCCNHPYLFPNAEDRNLDPMGEHLVENCGKMILLDKLLTRLKEAGHRVLVFSQMTRMMDILEDLMHMREYKYCRIDGNTPHDVRQDLIEEYNAPGSEKFVFLLSTRAGGLGINLQSADTCILYDSDWNPQADLQAQDRCHRIGQTKTVKVYRLVTEDTIEEKVVERAQQKLKLDAMVVQRGMLQGEKKLEKNELLAAIRFGADAVFRCKDTMMTDQDLDAVLERGAKKTQEMQSKLNVAEKGDMLDFSFDDGSGVQNFEGINYGDRKLRDQMRAGFIDIGRRERKPAAVKAYAPPPPRVEPKKMILKLPKELELPRMKDHQMFDRVRIVELQDQLQDKFKALKDRGTKIPVDCEDIASLLLPRDLVEERARLVSEGFPGWTRNHFYGFVDGMAIYGRARLELVAPLVGKPVEEVVRYSEAFWKQGPKAFTPDAWRRIRTRVEMREKKLAEVDRTMMVANALIEGVDDPWNTMEVRINQRLAGGGAAAGMQLQREWTKDEDRYLLCLTHLCGWGNWRKVRASILASPRFTFDYYLRSLSEGALGKHCEQLLKSSEKYLADLHDRMKKEDKREMEERAGRERDEIAAAREEEEYEARLRHADSMIEAAEDELEEAESKKGDLEVIAEGLTSGKVSVDNPNVRALLEACAAAGIGTTGLNTKSLMRFAGDGGRKSPALGGRKSTSPGGAKRPLPGKDQIGDDEMLVDPSTDGVDVGGDDSEGGGKRRMPHGSAANGDAARDRSAKGDRKMSSSSTHGNTDDNRSGRGGKSGGRSGTVEAVATKKSDARDKSEMADGELAEGKAAAAAAEAARRKSSGDGVSKAKRTPTKSVGKPGLALPTTLYPELARLIHEGELTSKEEMLHGFQKKHPAFTQVSISKAVGVLGEKPSRGSKWKVFDKGKKYLNMPVHEGTVPEEVAVLAALAAKRKSGDSDSLSSKKRKSTTPSKGKVDTAKSPITKFFPPKENAEESNAGSSKKRRVTKGSGGAGASGGASAGFVAFCRANRTRVQAEVASGSKADTADRLLHLWGQLDQGEVHRWNTGALPAISRRG